jgi:hypothetical protein
MQIFPICTLAGVPELDPTAVHNGGYIGCSRHVTFATKRDFAEALGGYQRIPTRDTSHQSRFNLTDIRSTAVRAPP